MKSTASSDGAAYDGAKRVKGCKLPPGRRPVWPPARRRRQSGRRTGPRRRGRAVRGDAGGSAGCVTAAFVDQGRPGAGPATAVTGFGRCRRRRPVAVLRSHAANVTRPRREHGASAGNAHFGEATGAAMIRCARRGGQTRACTAVLECSLKTGTPRLLHAASAVHVRGGKLPERIPEDASRCRDGLKNSQRVSRTGTCGSFGMRHAWHRIHILRQSSLYFSSR